MSVDISALVDGAYRDFGTAIAAMPVVEDGSVTQVQQAWQAARTARADLAQIADKIAEGIQAIQDTPYPQMTEAQRADAIQIHKDLWNANHQSAVKKVQDSLAQVRSSLEAAAVSDLVPAEASERGLIRDEIDKYVAAITKPAQVAGDGRAFRPGDDVKTALLKLATSNPDRYGAEIASTYGQTLLAAGGQGREYGDLVRLVRLSTPGTTPKSQNARAALAAMQRSRIEGMTGGLSHLAKQKVEAALTPKTPERGMYRPDTIRPRS